MPDIIPFLWFDGRAEEAANFYVATFRACGRQAAIKDELRYTESGPGAKGSVLTLAFTLGDREFVALNGGPHFSFTPAISFLIPCTDQADVDRLWDKLVAGGAPSQCGWLTDRFGVSWQVVPTALYEMLKDPDRARADRVMQAMMPMRKLDIATLKTAYQGG